MRQRKTNMFKKIVAKVKAVLVPAKAEINKKVDDLVVEAEKLAAKADDKVEQAREVVAEQVQAAVAEAVAETVKKKSPGRPKGSSPKKAPAKKAPAKSTSPTKKK